VPPRAYYPRSRRWIEVTLLKRLEDIFTNEFFLLDTGSPTSYITESSAAKIRHKRLGQPVNGMTKYIRVDIEECNVVLEVIPANYQNYLILQESVDIPALKYRHDMLYNINLLGVNFIDSFVFIDDKIGRNIVLAKRPTPNPNKWNAN